MHVSKPKRVLLQLLLWELLQQVERQAEVNSSK